MISKDIPSLCKDYVHIENYSKAVADKTKTWHCHHRLETHNSDGEKRLVLITPKELMALGMYYDRPANEFIFLTREEHISLHHKDSVMTDEQRQRLSESCMGREPWNKATPWEVYTEQAMYLLHYNRERTYVAWNKGIPHTEEAKRKMSESQKARKGQKQYMQTEEYKKAVSEGQKRRYANGGKPSRGSTGMHWFNNGIENAFAFECPEGFTKGKLPCKVKITRKPFSEESRKRLSEAHKGKHLSKETKKKLSLNSKGRKWFNNGVISIMRFECPEGFVEGRLPRTKEN